MTALDAARAVFRAHIESHQGRVIDMAGDSVLAVFDAAAGAVAAALAVQEQLKTMAAPMPEERRMRFRIGVHLGDAMEKADGTVYGDGVNIAARLEGLAEPGGVTVSEAIHVVLRDRVPVRFEDQGELAVKNIVRPAWPRRSACSMRCSPFKPTIRPGSPNSPTCTWCRRSSMWRGRSPRVRWQLTRTRPTPTTSGRSSSYASENRTRLALRCAREAIKLNPRAPEFYLTAMAEAYVGLCRYDEALPPLRRIVSRRPEWLMAQSLLAIVLMALGQAQPAQQVIDTMRKQSPKFTVFSWLSCIFYPNRPDIPKLSQLLVAAGLPP